jgi:hypothetical protein
VAEHGLTAADKPDGRRLLLQRTRAGLHGLAALVLAAQIAATSYARLTPPIAGPCKRCACRP